MKIFTIKAINGFHDPLHDLRNVILVVILCHTTSLTSVVDESCYVKKRRKLVERCSIIIKKPNFTWNSECCCRCC